MAGRGSGSLAAGVAPITLAPPLNVAFVSVNTPLPDSNRPPFTTTSRTVSANPFSANVPAFTVTTAELAIWFAAPSRSVPLFTSTLPSTTLSAANAPVRASSNSPRLTNVRPV